MSIEASKRLAKHLKKPKWLVAVGYIEIGDKRTIAIYTKFKYPAEYPTIKKLLKDGWEDCDVVLHYCGKSAPAT